MSRLPSKRSAVTGNVHSRRPIYSSNLGTNQSVVSVNPAASDNFVPTQYVPGSGNDTIVLPIGATFSRNNALPDVHNYLGPTATPIIISNITIEANGSLLQWTGPGYARAFALGERHPFRYG
jgi:hypothetical protein